MKAIRDGQGEDDGQRKDAGEICVFFEKLATKQKNGIHEWVRKRAINERNKKPAPHMVNKMLEGDALHGALVRHTCGSDTSFVEHLIGKMHGVDVDTVPTRRSTGRVQELLTFPLVDVLKWLLSSAGPILMEENFLKFLGVDEHPKRHLHMTTMGQIKNSNERY